MLLVLFRRSAGKMYALAVACLFSLNTAGAGCFSAPGGVLGWWPGDGDATDIANGHNGTLQGGATASSPGLVNTAFAFDGTNAYAQIPDSPALRPTNFTLEAWVRFTGLDSAGLGGSPAGDQYIIFRQNTRSGDFEGFDLSKTRVAGTDYFRFLVTSAAGVLAELHSATTVSTGVWYHVAAVRGTNFTQLYVNGVLERQTNVSFAQDYGNYPLYFGTSGQSFWDHKFKGNLDEATLYGRALSPAEIAGIYSAGAAGKCKSVSLNAQPQSQTLVAGSDVILSAAATGYGTLSYRWQFNGAPIPGATQANLEYPHVGPAQAGAYHVTVSNAWSGMTSTDAVVGVISLVAWGRNDNGQTNLPPGLTNMAAVGNGNAYSLVVTANGAVAGSGDNSLGQIAIPPNLTNAVCVAGALYHSLALRSDGTVAGWGFNGYGAATPPPDLHDAVAIAAGEEHSLALRGDGTVTGWGWDVEGQVTPPPGLSNVIGIAAGRLHSLAVRSDGTVVAWGNNAYGQTTVPMALTNAVAVAAGYYHSMALGSDGSVWAWGDGSFGQTIIPNGLNRVVAIAAGGNHCLAITSNGFVVAWGDSSAGQTIVPNWLSNVVALAQGGEHCVAIPGGRPFLAGQPRDQTVIAATAAQFHVSTTWNSLALNYQWQFNGTNLARGTNAILRLPNVSLASTGNYQVVVANMYGAVTSAPAKLTVVFPPTIVQGPVNQTSSVPRTITFSVTATGAQPLSYQWQKDGASVAGASGTALVLPSVTRTNSGSYSVVITNLYGIAVSSNAYLAVRLPQRLSPPALMPDGSLSLTSSDSDGGAPTSADLSHLHAYASTNLVDWVSLPGALSITNGVLQLQDAPCPACAERFYRIVESW